MQERWQNESLPSAGISLLSCKTLGNRMVVQAYTHLQ
jgi:hypothetical protein